MKGNDFGGRGGRSRLRGFFKNMKRRLAQLEGDPAKAAAFREKCARMWKKRFDLGHW